MARLIFAIVPLALACAAQDEPFQRAGVCGRCHVISVVEWSISRHAKAGTGCTACHGPSEGHVSDERNNVKPERIPRGALIPALCLTCHTEQRKTAVCHNCHHFHALVDPSKPPSAQDERLERLIADWQQADRRLAEGERRVKLGEWEKAREEFRAVLASRPGDRRAAARLKMCERRINPELPGLEVVRTDLDPESGLPRAVRVAGLGIEMVLVPGGEIDIGSDRFPVSKPVHTVRVEPFYLGKFEVSQEEWNSLMGSNPSAKPGDGRQPVEQISWDDAQALVGKLNQRVPGGGFRLPTEAEWEYAARTDQANKLGLFDMQGSVWEWCSSLYLPYPYDPADGREAPAGQGLRTLRGGGFAVLGDQLDPAFRHGERPGARLRTNGVRIARTP